MNVLPINRLQEYFREQEEREAIKLGDSLEYIGGPAELMAALATQERLERIEPRVVFRCERCEANRHWCSVVAILSLVGCVACGLVALWRE